MKRALITGITGQDGSYLAEHLLSLGYAVHGVIRRSSTGNTKNINKILDRITLHQGDITDPLCIDRIIKTVDPHELYHEADQDNVDWSFVLPGYQVDVTVKAVVNLLQSVREHCPSCRVFIPCSATMFGNAPAPQNEQTPFNPLSPYAVAKTAVYHLARMYRQNYGMFVTVGILYNHDSPRRKGNYLLHKICKAACYCRNNLTKKVEFSNLHDLIAVGSAAEFVIGFQQLLQLPYAGDFVMGSKDTTLLRILLLRAFAHVDLNAEEYVIETAKSDRCVKPHTLIPECTKIEDAIGWYATKSAATMIDVLMEKYKFERCD